MNDVLEFYVLVTLLNRKRRDSDKSFTTSLIADLIKLNYLSEEDVDSVKKEVLDLEEKISTSSSYEDLHKVLSNEIKHQ